MRLLFLAAQLVFITNIYAENLSSGTPAIGSSVYIAEFQTLNVTDDNPSSRWSSSFTDNEWIYVDLQAVYTIDRVVLNWETAFGRGYEIQTSTDAQSWTTIFTESNGDGGIDDITLPSVVNTRYVRMLGIQRGTGWGYSLFEFEVYGSSEPTDPPVLTTVTVEPDSITVAVGGSTTFTATALDQYGGTYPSTVTWSVTGGGSIASTSDMAGSFSATTIGGPFTVEANEGTLQATALVTVVDSLPTPSGNLALGTAVTTSSTFGDDLLSTYATDDNPSSRWSSSFTDNEWIYVDLQAVYTIDRVVLNWETAFGRGYEIQTSTDAQSWTTIFTESNGDGGIDDITLPSVVNTRYVRMLGIQRSTGWGYSLFEFEVYGSSEPTDPPVLTTVTVEPDSITVAVGGSTTFTATALDQYGGTYPSTVTWSVTGGGSIASTSDMAGSFSATTIGGPFTVEANEGTLQATALVTVVDSLPTPSGNLALGTAVTTSSTFGDDLLSTYATDDNPSSRWSSSFTDNEWIYVDLQAVYTIDRVVLNWETAFGRGYEIQTSTDAQSWTTIFTESNGDGGIDDITLPSVVNTRYVRMLGIQRSTGWGYSLFEFEVYGLDGPLNRVPTAINVTPTRYILSLGNTVQFSAQTIDQFGDPVGSNPQFNWDVSAGGTIDNTGLYSGQVMGGPFIISADDGGLTGQGKLWVVDAAPINTNLNVAADKPSSASSQESVDTTPDLATDGLSTTHWASKVGGTQWIQIDLERQYGIERVLIDWLSGSQSYSVQLSQDGISWTTVFSTSSGDGGIDDHTFDARLSRFVRILSTEGAPSGGQSIGEIAVFGRTEVTNPPDGVCLADPKKIVLIGDSITQADADHSSYRRGLWNLIMDDGFSVNFIGSEFQNDNGPNPTPDFDMDHEGHWGWRADEIANQLPVWTASYAPDIALIHIGTNDILQGESTESTILDLESIISTLRQANTNINILLAQILPLNGTVGDEALNESILALSINLTMQASPIIVVDQHSNFDPSTSTYDGLHPNETGERVVADRWSSALQPILQQLCTDHE